MDAITVKNINNEFSQMPLEEKTIIFIEDFFNGASGIISSIFRKIMTNPVFRDYKLVWMTRDYEETLKIFGSWLDASRVWLCIENGHDYLKYLCVAKYIYTAKYLPHHFIKRDGQMVFYAPTDILIQKKHYTKAMLMRFCATVNNADKIIMEKGLPGNDYFIKRFVPDGRESFFENSDDDLIERGKSILVSVMDSARSAKNLQIFQYVYDRLESMAEAYGFCVHWKVSFALYKKYRDDELSCITFKNIHCGDEDCNRLLRTADIVIADSLTDMVYGSKYCENTIFYYNENNDYEFVDLKNTVQATGDFEMLLDLYEKKLGGSVFLQNSVDLNTKPILFDCPEELKGVSDFYEIQASDNKINGNYDPGPDDRPEILIMTETFGFDLLASELHNMLIKYSEKVRLTVFYKSSWKGTLFEQLSDFTTDISYICGCGEIRCTDYEREKIVKEINWKRYKTLPLYYRGIRKLLNNNWIRLIGDKRFDGAVMLELTNKFWKNMSNTVPAEKIKKFNRKGTSEELVDAIENSLKEMLKDITV